MLWDCISFLDDTTITIIKALGGLAGIACSHPHFLARWWNGATPSTSCRSICMRWTASSCTRLDPVLTFWEGDRLELAEGVNLIRCGGHFPGSAVLHWAQGAGGQGALLTGDTLQVRPDKGLTFMHSYPNLIPLDAVTVRQIADALAPGRSRQFTAAGGNG